MDIKWTVKRDVGTQGQPRFEDVCTVSSLEYHGEWMGDEYVQVTVRSDVPVDFHLYDFVEYRSERFLLWYDPNVVKKAGTQTVGGVKKGKYGDGFVYDGIKFHAVSHELRFIDFKDVVLADNHEAYTSLSEFAFFAGSVEDLADRLQANLQRVNADFTVYTPDQTYSTHRGCDASVWAAHYSDDSPKGEKDVNVSVTKEQKCWDMLSLVYSQFGLSWYCSGYNIFIGADPVSAEHIFQYGRGNGLYEVERTSDDEQELVTKVYAYGSTENLPLNYYASTGKKMMTPGERVTVEVDDNDVLGLRTTLPYETIHNALTGSDITLQFGQHTVKVSCNPYVVSQQQMTLWYFIDTAEKNTEFYEALGDGIQSQVFVVSGADIALWPSAAIYTPSDYDYPAGLSINRLMLPGFPTVPLHDWVELHHPELLSKYIFSTDPHNPWIKSMNSLVIGELEGSVFFDGSDQKEILPSIEGATASVGAGSIRLDEIQDCDPITDNGFIAEGEEVKPFPARVYGGDIEWGYSGGDVVISMKSGFCTGREFKVSKATAVGNTFYVDLLLERKKDDAVGRWFPNDWYGDGNRTSDAYQIMGAQQRGGALGDTFVVTGVPMPKSLVDAASERLLIAACGWLDKRDHVRYTYVPRVDEIYMARQDDAVEGGNDIAAYGTVSLHDTLKAGMQMQFLDSDLGIERYNGNGRTAPFIDTLTIKENGNNGIPTYDVVLRDEKEKGALEKLTEDIKALTENPPVQVVERQQRTLQYIYYDTWTEGQSYYCETLNVDEDRLETSIVWWKNCQWMCKRSFTADEPWFTSSDWVCVQATDLALQFFDNSATPQPLTVVPVRIGSIDFTVVPYLLLGNEDVTAASIQSWRWTRESFDTASDAAWNALDNPKTTGRNLTITDRPAEGQRKDIPDGYARGRKLEFVCTATLRFELDGEETTIMNRVVF